MRKVCRVLYTELFCAIIPTCFHTYCCSVIPTSPYIFNVFYTCLPHEEVPAITLQVDQPNIILLWLNTYRRSGSSSAFFAHFSSSSLSLSLFFHRDTHDPLLLTKLVSTSFCAMGLALILDVCGKTNSLTTCLADHSSQPMTPPRPAMAIQHTCRTGYTYNTVILLRIIPWVLI